MDKRFNVKKILIVVSIIVLLLACAFMLVFYTGDDHIPGKVVKEDATDPTCANRGSYCEVTYCLKCDEEIKRERKYTDRLDHNFSGDICTICGFDSSVPESTPGLSFLVSRDENGYEVYHLQDIGTCIDAEELVIGSYNGRPVTKILYGALEQCKNLRRVVIHDTVEEIQSYAFDGCSNLESIVLPNNKHFEIIEFGTFRSCTSLVSINLPETIKKIGDQAFFRCTSLKNVTLPSNIRELGTDSFRYCFTFTEITIPSKLTTIGKSSFAQCVNVEKLTINNGVANIDNQAFYGCSKLYDISLPDSLSSIGESAFNGCVSITSIKLGDNIKTIGASAFFDCTGLSSVDFGNSVNDIQTAAFSNCSALTSAKLPQSVITLGSAVFSECDSLVEVVLPDSIIRIYEETFRGCSNLKKVTFGTGLIYLGARTFADCTALEEVVFLDSSNWQRTDDTYAGGETIQKKYLSNPKTAAICMTNEKDNGQEWVGLLYSYLKKTNR